MARNDNSELMLCVAAVAVGLPLLFIYQAAKNLGVEFGVLLSAVGYSIFWIACYGGWLYYKANFSNDYNETLFGNALFWLPVLLLAIWPCWWEVLLQMGAHGVPSFARDTSDFTEWYSSGFFRWLIEFSFAGLFVWRLQRKYAS